MTLPASGAISLTLVMSELRIGDAGRAYPISLGDSDVRALAGKPSGPISLSDLYGKSATPPAQPMTLYPSGSNVNRGSTESGGGTGAINFSVAVLGGARPLSYLWSIVSADGRLVQKNGFTDGPSFNFELTYAQNSSGTAQARVRCVVTDANGATADTGVIQGSLTWGTPA